MFGTNVKDEKIPFQTIVDSPGGLYLSTKFWLSSSFFVRH